MEAGPRTARSWRGWLSLAWPGLVLALAFFAYRPLFASALHVPGRSEVERWFFRQDPLSAPLVLGAVGWLLWRRRERLRSLPPGSAPGIALALFAAGGACFLWALRTRAADLLLVSIAANLLAFAAAAKGRAGSRAVLLPAAALLLGLRIPDPLLNELVWHLQVWTARAAAGLLPLLGAEIHQSGVVLRSDNGTFQVIEACSGLRGIQILTVVALIVRELFAYSGPRQWLLVCLAPALGYAINVVRIALVASSAHPEELAGVGADHTPQGVAVLVAGTGILYALGSGMAGFRRPRAAPEPPSTPPWRERRAPWRPLAAWLVALGALSIFVPPFAEAHPANIARSENAARAKIEFPESRSDWTSEPLVSDPLFVGTLPANRRVHRRFERSPRSGPHQIVELFVGFEDPAWPGSSRLLSSKFLRPGPDWSIERRRRARLWVLGRDSDFAVVSREDRSQYAVVSSWRLRDEGPWWEAARSLLALESTPFRRQQQRAIVRLAAPIPRDEPLLVDRAKQAIERFVVDFQDVLADL